MNDRRLDRLARALAARPPSRRALLGTLVAGALGGLAAGLADVQVVAALRGPGRPCERAGQCDSGICRGPRGRKRCRCDDGQRPCRGVCCGPLNVCDDGQCVDHCASGKIDGPDESDVDCGGNRCPKCAVGRRCFFPTDCASGVCNENRCAQCGTDDQCDLIAPFCVGNRCRPCRSDAESNCPPGQFCVDNDCAQCRDNGDCLEERPVCNRFGVCVDRCRRDGDCPSGQRCRDGRCHGGSDASCRNGVQDGDETDIDCGGGRCPKCGVAKLCRENPDCETGHCGSADLGDGNGLRRQCVECFRDKHCSGGQACSGHFCED